MLVYKKNRSTIYLHVIPVVVPGKGYVENFERKREN
jgi:hypothetical protein